MTTMDEARAGSAEQPDSGGVTPQGVELRHLRYFVALADAGTLASEWHRVMLRGRGQQCETLDGLLADVRAGRSRALVVRGEPGIGKTALLGYAAETAQDFQLARAVGVESEMELPFPALHQLCCPWLSRIG